MQLKEIKMRPKIDEHDYEFKVQHARDFLGGRDKVKVTVTFRGREMAHQEIGHKLIQRVLADLTEISTVESPPRSEGRTLSAVLMPKAHGTAKPTTDSAPRAARPSTDAAPAPRSAPRATPAKAADSPAG
jgi:translation initiation factor IF-3